MDIVVSIYRIYTAWAANNKGAYETTDAQADLHLCCTSMPYFFFVMMQLVYVWSIKGIFICIQNLYLNFHDFNTAVHNLKLLPCH